MENVDGLEMGRTSVLLFVDGRVVVAAAAIFDADEGGRDRLLPALLVVSLLFLLALVARRVRFLSFMLALLIFSYLFVCL